MYSHRNLDTTDGQRDAYDQSAHWTSKLLGPERTEWVASREGEQISTDQILTPPDDFSQHGHLTRYGEPCSDDSF
ncbi:hypothetical protein J6590_036788 [Homalodisca vitripennis]|nr:hypothetical protein J6590_036788 [Homalodisca vitripennis]